jgi:hypothetical protein
MKTGLSANREFGIHLFEQATWLCYGIQIPKCERGGECGASLALRVVKISSKRHKQTFASVCGITDMQYCDRLARAKRTTQIDSGR